jgi:hypothetical protein
MSFFSGGFPREVLRRCRVVFESPLSLSFFFRLKAAQGGREDMKNKPIYAREKNTL